MSSKSKSVFKLFHHFLNKYPITSQSIQTGFLMGLGDFLAQTVIEKRSLKELDVPRAAEFTAVGLFLVGPSVSTWYRFMQKHVKPSPKGGDRATIALKKVALDQLCFSPIGLAAVLTTLSVLKGKNFDGIKEDVGSQYCDVLIANYKVWPAVQLINFYLLPLKYQLLFGQIVAILWNVYLSERTQHP